MKKIMRLVSVQLWVVLGDMLAVGKNRRKKQTGIYIGVAAFILLLSAISFFYSFLIGSGLQRFHCIEILPGLMMAVTCIIILITTTLKVKGTIFAFRDYDMVMSLPVSTGVIIASRLIILYLLNFMFVIIIMLPMMIAYGILVQPDILFYIIGFVAMFNIPLVPIVAASLLGTIVAYVASRFRHSNLLSIIFTLGFLVLIMVFSFSLNDNGKEMADMSRALTQRINAIYPLAWMYSAAVVHYKIADFLMFLAISAAAFWLYTAVVKTVFKRLNTLLMTGMSHTNYKLGSLKASSPFRALYVKELKRFFSSTLYVTNSGFGIVMLTLAAVAVIFVDLDKVFGSPQAVDAIIKGGPIYISFCIIMTCTSMASISLEGKSLWIIKSLPVSPKTVYLSKIAVNLTVIAPAMADIIIIGIALKMGLLQTVMMLLTAAACAVFISFYGLLINLLLPNFNWTSETVVIKNSAATMVTIFSAMAYVAVQFMFIALLPSMTEAYLCYFLLTVVLDAVLYAVLMTYGKRRYNFL